MLLEVCYYLTVACRCRRGCRGWCSGADAAQPRRLAISLSRPRGRARAVATQQRAEIMLDGSTMACASHGHGMASLVGFGGLGGGRLLGVGGRSLRFWAAIHASAAARPPSYLQPTNFRRAQENSSRTKPTGTLKVYALLAPTRMGRAAEQGRSGQFMQGKEVSSSAALERTSQLSTTDD